MVARNADQVKIEVRGSGGDLVSTHIYSLKYLQTEVSGYTYQPNFYDAIIKSWLHPARFDRHPELRKYVSKDVFQSGQIVTLPRYFPARSADSRAAGPMVREFQVGRTLGEGAFGAVHLVSFRDGGRDKAIKIMTSEPSRYLPFPSSTTRQIHNEPLQELFITAFGNHLVQLPPRGYEPAPIISTEFFFHQHVKFTGPSMWLLMPRMFCPLQLVLQQLYSDAALAGKPAVIAVAGWAVRGVLTGLSQLHEQMIAHGDLTPRNVGLKQRTPGEPIFLSEENKNSIFTVVPPPPPGSQAENIHLRNWEFIVTNFSPVLLDFGSSTVTARIQRFSITNSRLKMVTSTHRPPELYALYRAAQAKQNISRTFDPRTFDLWAVGVLALQSLAGLRSARARITPQQYFAQQLGWSVDEIWTNDNINRYSNAYPATFGDETRSFRSALLADQNATVPDVQLLNNALQYGLMQTSDAHYRFLAYLATNESARDFPLHNWTDPPMPAELQPIVSLASMTFARLKPLQVVQKLLAENQYAAIARDDVKYLVGVIQHNVAELWSNAGDKDTLLPLKLWVQLLACVDITLDAENHPAWSDSAGVIHFYRQHLRPELVKSKVVAADVLEDLDEIYGRGGKDDTVDYVILAESRNIVLARNNYNIWPCLTKPRAAAVHARR